ncbi:MAG TPA: DUF3043 domain-containing protein [Candidatus Microbacterium pullistercoris]|nr:DUF3043 domain-containing protein [Candidatus Microbacterium pullistercoris]
MAKNAQPADDAATPEQKTVGKGRPTPTRAEQQAKRVRPLVATTKEAKKAARSEMRERQERARVGMQNGEERFLGPRDKGPQRRFARDWTDAGWHLAEFVMPAMVLVILLSLIPLPFMQFWSFIGLWGFIILAIVEMVFLARRVKKKAADKWGDRREKGLGWYAAMRSIQMRFMRIPKPQVRRGEYPRL